MGEVQRARTADAAGGRVRRRAGEDLAVWVRGNWGLRCRQLNGRLRWAATIPNLVVDTGLNEFLNGAIGGGTQHTLWYIGLIDNGGSPSFSAIAAGDTLASHAGWSECNPYSGNRPAWTPGAASGKSMTNASTVNFAITGTKTVKGIFLCSAASGSSGILFSAAAFSSGTKSVVNTDTLECTYTVNMTSS